MNIKLLALTFLTCGIAFGEGPAPAETFQTQASMNAEASKRYADADKKLNEVYRAVLKKPELRAHRQAIKTAQQKWIQYRDAELQALYPEGREPRSSGTLEGVSRPESARQLTELRTRVLEQWLLSATDEEGSNVNENPCSQCGK